MLVDCNVCMFKHKTKRGSFGNIHVDIEVDIDADSYVSITVDIDIE